jgi:hypothetical protein
MNALDGLDAEAAKCAGLSPADLERQYDLITFAARGGVFEAQLDYFMAMKPRIQNGEAIRRPNAMDEIRENAVAFALAAARTGDPKALYYASRMFADNRFIPADPAREYQFLEIYSRSRGATPETQARLDELVAMLTPEQLRQLRQQ